MLTLRRVGLASFVLSITAAAHAQLRTVAVFEDPAPGTAALFDFFGAPVINSQGAVAFTADLDDGFSGLWSEASGVGSLQNVILAGDAAPGAAGAFIEAVLEPEDHLHFNDLGHVAFLAELDDFTQAVYADRAGGLTLIAREGDAAADTGAGRTYNFGFRLDGFGNTHSGVAFDSSLTAGDPPNDFPSQSVYSEGTGATLTSVAEIGDLAPGSFRPSVSGLANFDSFQSPISNDSGRVVFAATTNASTGVDSVGAGGVWTDSPGGGLRAVALQGEIAPGTSAEFSQIFGVSGSWDSTPVINDDGDVALVATLTGLIGGQLRAGVWAESDGVLRKVALESEAAPGTASTFESIDADPLIDAAGNTTLVATLASGVQGIWQEESIGDLQPLVFEGDASPVDGADFDNVIEIAVNDAGQVAFTADLDTGASGLFATDPSGELTKVMLTGDTVDLGGTILVVEEINFIGLNGPLEQLGSSVTSGLNNSGQLAFTIAGELQDELGGTGEFIDAIVVSDAATGGSFLAGDFNDDGVVDALDYAVWREGLGGEFDASDFVLWRGNYGASLSAAVATPEPSAIAVLAAVLAAMGVAYAGRKRTA